MGLTQAFDTTCRPVPLQALDPWPADGGTRQKAGGDVNAHLLRAPMNEAFARIAASQPLFHHEWASLFGDGYSAADLTESVHPARILDAESEITDRVVRMIAGRGWWSTGRQSLLLTVKGGRVQVSVAARAVNLTRRRSTFGTLTGNPCSDAAAAKLPAAKLPAPATRRGSLSVGGLPALAVRADILLHVDLAFTPDRENFAPPGSFATEHLSAIVGVVQWTELEL